MDLNKPDIAPYSRAEADGLGHALIGLGIPSIGSPQLSIRMLEIAQAIETTLKSDQRLTPEMAAVIESFRLRLLDVALVNGAMAGEVIARLSRILGEDKKGAPHGS